MDDLAADHGCDNTRLANGLEQYRKVMPDCLDRHYPP
jgi:hypothetical protein